MADVSQYVGRYRLEQQLGQGAMAVVWKAFDPSTDRYVAVKILKPAYERDPDYRTRFLREARAAGALQHPNIVQLFEVTEEAGAPAIIMELVDGPSLAELIERQGALAPADARRLLPQLAGAIGHAHARGRVHRDLKPSNILLTRDLRTVKVADFGIAQIAQDATEITQVGQLIGTPRYMAPEQLEGGRVDARADLFALGAVAYEMLSGARAFDGSSLATLSHQICNLEPRSLRERAPAVPADLADAVARLLRKRPEDRFATAEAFAAAISGEGEAGFGSFGFDLPPLPSDPLQVAARAEPPPRAAGPAPGGLDLFSESFVSGLPHVERRPAVPPVPRDEGRTRGDHAPAPFTALQAPVRDPLAGPPLPEASAPVREADDPFSPGAGVPLPSVPPAEEPAGRTVRFAVYHPKAVRPGAWHTLTAYVHVPEAAAEVDEDANSRIGSRGSHNRSVAARTGTLVRGAEVSIVPELPGFSFNPPVSRLLWLEDWHRAEFRFRSTDGPPRPAAGVAFDGRVAFYVGSVLVGEVAIWAHLVTDPAQAYDGPPCRAVAVPFTAVFASYAREDGRVVAWLARAYRCLDIRLLRDVEVLRSGERWNEKLLGLIDQADVFQLYWSAAAKRSRYVREEWRHALSRRKNEFIRPVYWETPMPGPPRDLADLHFAYLGERD